MGKIAFLFAGQGAQYPGMGKELYETSPAARRVFDMTEHLLPGNLAMCFDSTAEQLKVTSHTQPALFAMDLAAACAAQDAGIHADVVAGFSLGEIAALAFGGILSEEDAFRLVVQRGRWMEECAKAHPGSMAAVLKLPDETVEQLCCGFSNVYPVNYNCPGQVAVAGDSAEMEALAGKVSEAGGRAIPIAVSGAFHTPFMRTASEKIGHLLESMQITEGRMPVYSNLTAQPYGQNPKEYVARQAMSPVLFSKIIHNMMAAGVDTFVEVGAGTTLSGFVRRIDKTVSIHHIENSDDVGTVLTALHSV